MMEPHPKIAFDVTIRCLFQRRLVYFRVPSDMEWWAFRSKVCKRMGVNRATARLAYRQFHDILYGSLCRLRGSADWAEAIMKMKIARKGDAVTELEIIDVARSTLVSVTSN